MRSRFAAIPACLSDRLLCSRVGAIQIDQHAVNAGELYRGSLTFRFQLVLPAI
jgi:hypothetical protein